MFTQNKILTDSTVLFLHQGSCSEGGKIRPEGGDSFTCVDNTNICSCTTQGFSTTLMGYNRELFCNAAMGQ